MTVSKGSVLNTYLTFDTRSGRSLHLSSSPCIWNDFFTQKRVPCINELLHKLGNRIWKSKSYFYTTQLCKLYDYRKTDYEKYCLSLHFLLNHTTLPPDFTLANWIILVYILRHELRFVTWNDHLFNWSSLTSNDHLFNPSVLNHLRIYFRSQS